MYTCYTHITGVARVLNNSTIHTIYLYCSIQHNIFAITGLLLFNSFFKLTKVYCNREATMKTEEKSLEIARIL